MSGLKTISTDMTFLLLFYIMKGQKRQEEEAMKNILQNKSKNTNVADKALLQIFLTDLLVALYSLIKSTK